VLINADLVMRQYMLGNQENTRNKAKANQYTKGVILIEATLIKDIQVKGAL
jgi:hypothetical protein